MTIVSRNDGYSAQSDDGTIRSAIFVSSKNTGTGADTVQGSSAAGATDDGSNPVKVGGVFLTTNPTLTTGQRGNLSIGPGGFLNTIISGTFVTGADGASNALQGGADYRAGNNPIGSPGYLFAQAVHVFNGASWDRMRGDTTGTFAVGNVASVASDAGNPVKIGAVYQTAVPAPTNGQRVNLQAGPGGELVNTNRRGNLTLADGSSNVITTFVGTDNAGATSGIQFNTLGSVYDALATTWQRSRGDVAGAWASSGQSTSRITSAAATTNATSAKASPGRVNSIIATNTTASIKYLKLYNKASAPTVGTDTPVLTIALPPSNTIFNLNLGGMTFSTGIAYALTGVNTDADATALAAGDVVGLNIIYT